MPPTTSKPVKGVLLYDSRGKPLRYSGGSNRMIGPATQNWDRKRVPPLDDDVHRNLTSYGRRILMSLGRHIYFASGAVRGAVEDLVTGAAGAYMFEYRGEDLDYKNRAEEKLYLHDRVCDVAGPPHTMRSARKLVVRSLYFDGDVGTVLVRGADGQPYLQIIPSHRIASEDEIVKQRGPTDGARIIDGVIVDDLNRPLAYRVLTGEPGDFKEFQDIPASAMALHFQPLLAGQLRGIPILGLAGWDQQDLDEARRWELLAQKGAAARVFQEFNEEGEAQPGSDHIVGPTAGTDASGTPTGLWREVIDGGLNTYFKAGTGSGLKAVEFNRPSRDQQAFSAQVLRESMSGSRLSWDYNLDLTKIGGASLRVLISKINSTHEDLQCECIEPFARRFDFFRLGTWIDRKELPAAVDWWNFEYQPGAKITADAKYDSDVMAQNVRAGFDTRTRAAARLGESLGDNRRTREQESDDLYTIAERLHAKHPTIPLTEIIIRLESDNPNPIAPQPAQPAPGDGGPPA